MATILLAFVIIALSLAGLAIGVLIGRAPLAGSCGGSACSDCAKTGAGVCKQTCKRACELARECDKEAAP